MRVKNRLPVVLMGVCLSGALAATQTLPPDQARAWVLKAAAAMGGEARLRGLHAVLQRCLRKNPFTVIHFSPARLQNPVQHRARVG